MQKIDYVKLMLHKKPNKMKVKVIGLGLIGCSMARGLKESGFASHITGADIDPAHQKIALEKGYVDKTESISEGISDCDLIIIAAPVISILDLLPQVLDKCNEQVVTDVGSTKAKMALRIEKHPKRSNYVAAHPIAGTEYSGPEASEKDLFNKKITILCDKERSSSKALTVVQQMYTALNMRLIYMNSYDHDIHSAYVSHISHISSFSLALSVLEKEKEEKNILAMAGAGFESTVRLAKSNADMWTPIFIQNRDNVLEVLDDYIEKLKSFREAIFSGETSEITNLILQANNIIKILEPQTIRK